MQILPVLFLRIINIIIYHFLSRIRIDVANTTEIVNKVNRRGMGRKSRVWLRPFWTWRKNGGGQ